MVLQKTPLRRFGRRISSLATKKALRSPLANIPFQLQTATRYLSTDVGNHKILSLPPQFLRAMDSSEFDPSTYQRTNVHYNPKDGRPLPESKSIDGQEVASCSFDAVTDEYHVVWNDGLVSHYPKNWVEQELSKWKGCQTDLSKKQMWADLTEEKVRSTNLSMSFQDAVQTDEGAGQALKALYHYGIVLVTSTPTEDGGAGIAALAAALGGGSVKDGNPTSLLSHFRNNSNTSIIQLPHGTDGPLRTLYGTVWSTSSSGQVDGASVADSAYGQEALPLHTDMTYQQDPPGLQIFTMVQPATRGGESLFGDGFAVAEHLRRVNPTAFATLSNTVRRFRCIDPTTGWHLEAHGPVIKVRNGQIVGIRHNDLDRLPDLPPSNCGNAATQSIRDFYESLLDAHHAWDELLSMDKFRLKMALQPGDTMVVANQRCFHGRYSFETTADTPRAVSGCYMSQDELNSRFRREGFVLP